MCNGILFEFLVQLSLIIYFLIIPLIVNSMWQDSDMNFIKFYFTKSPEVNYLGFFVFLVISSGVWFWYLWFMLLNGLFYVIYLLLNWLFEFLFLNKNCEHIKYEKGDKND